MNGIITAKGKEQTKGVIVVWAEKVGGWLASPKVASQTGGYKWIKLLI